MSALIIGIVLLCLSSIVGLIVYFVMRRGGGDTGPPVIVDVPQEMRCSSGAWGSDRTQRKNHNRGRLDSPQAWSANANSPGTVWYQMDNGKFATISGIAIKGRKDADQWVKTFTVKYRQNNMWKSVDGGATFEGNTDRDTQVVVAFSTPVNARYIRIYPQTYQGHISLRAALVTNSTNNGSNYGLLDVSGDNRDASSWWANNDDPNWHPRKGGLNSSTGWHPRSGAPTDGSEWHEMKLSGVRAIHGVALQGRGDGVEQWIEEFTVKYKNAGDQWLDVDGGFVFSGTGDNDTTVWAIFNAPVAAKSIRVYPKTWHNWYSGRFDLLGA